VIHQAIEKKPEKAFRERIAKGLVQEYPILKCGGDKMHAALSTSIRKRANNFHDKIVKIVSAPSTSKRKVPESSDQPESSSSSSQDTISTLEDRSNYTQSHGIKCFFEEYPDMRSPESVSMGIGYIKSLMKIRDLTSMLLRKEDKNVTV